MVRTVIGSLADSDFATRYAEPLFRLRYQVFHERLQWDVRCHDEMETDDYDDLWTRYVVALDDDDRVAGGWRLRPTVGNYMLADVFPQLLYGTPAPHHPRVWESNRFVCDKGAAKRGGFGFGEAARALFRATCEFGMANGIDEYIMVLSAGVYDSVIVINDGGAGTIRRVQMALDLRGRGGRMSVGVLTYLAVPLGLDADDPALAEWLEMWPQLKVELKDAMLSLEYQAD
jgi:N-acyl-L-homoserine lactone synthetase